MKTITEFSVTTIKNALKTREELTTAGKTPEELPAALGEALKLEGDKLTILLGALEVVEKKTNDLKRVVVLTIAEGEKAPQGAVQKDAHYFNIEFYPPLPGQERKGRGQGGEKGGRDGKGRGDKRGGKRGGGRDGGRDGKGRGPRGERAAGAPGGDAGAGGGGRRPPRPAGPRGPSRGPIPNSPITPASTEPRKPIQPVTPITPKATAPETSGDSTPSNS